jgi:hypothetical protein
MADGMSTLRQIDESLWVIDHPFKAAGIPVGTRTTLVRLSDGGLFLHSPGPLSVALAKQIDALGSVRCIIAPNMFHHLYVAENARAWQAATVHLAPGLATKRKDLSFNEELGDEPSPIWSADIDQVWVRGSKIVNEVVFLHRASRTLILTDLSFNFAHASQRSLRIFLKVMGAYGHFGPSRMMRFVYRDRALLRESVERILCWDFDRIVVSHGDLVEHDGRRIFADAFEWLDERRSAR